MCRTAELVAVPISAAARTSLHLTVGARVRFYFMSCQDLLSFVVDARASFSLAAKPFFRLA